MATASREEGSEGEATRAPPVWMTHVPEVDRIIGGSRFRNFPTPYLPTKVSTNTAAPVNPDLQDKVDHFSRIPSEILKCIISHLPMREAAATSVLSTRWRNLWTTSFSSLNFDVPTMLGYDYSNAIFGEKHQAYVATERSKFANCVNNITTQVFCHESRLDALRVFSILNKDYAPDIDRWITSSVALGVTEIHLDFGYVKFDLHDPYKEYELPAQLVASTVRYLYLKLCKLHIPPDFTGFTSLVSLSLDRTWVTQSLMENVILSKCPLLEFLSLRYCCYPKGTHFNFAGTSLRLKHLHIHSTKRITSIKLHNINLLSFELGTSSSKLSIQNAPHLARLVLLGPKPVDVISGTPRLKALSLVQSSEKPCAVPQTYVLNNLKQLQFIAHLCTTHLLGVVHILEACHSLQKLELDMGIGINIRERMYTMPGETEKKLTALPGFPLNNLIAIEIYGFEDYTEKVEFTKYLLKNAVVLQKMNIYTTSKVYHGNGRWEPREETWKQATRKQARSLEDIRKLLLNVARSSTKVELFGSLNL